MMNEKRCSKCEEVKPLGEFYPHKLTQDRLYASCKTCHQQQTNKDRKSVLGTFERKTIVAADNARRKAKKLGVESTLTLEEVREVFSADSCNYCDKHLEQSEKSLEHVIPYEYGGENTFGNVTLACLDCNKKKHATPAFEFMLLNGDANAGRRLLYTLAERNGIEPQEYLYTLAQAGIQYRTARLRKRFGAAQ